jgi:type I restriction enzyme S subunit
LSVFNLNHGPEVDFGEVKHISLERYEESPEIMVRSGDILLVKDGAGIGKLGIVAQLPAKATINSSLLLVRPTEVLEPKFLFYFLAGPELQNVVQQRITGSTTPHLFQRDVKAFDLAVAPLSEQRRIVAKIDALTAKSRRAKEALDAIPPLLDKLRQSILAAAFRGDLTADWRAAHPDVEPATQLLERIRAERRRRWEEAELAKMKAKGKPPTDDRRSLEGEVSGAGAGG